MKIKGYSGFVKGSIAFAIIFSMLFNALYFNVNFSANADIGSYQVNKSANDADLYIDYQFSLVETSLSVKNDVYEVISGLIFESVTIPDIDNIQDVYLLLYTNSAYEEYGSYHTTIYGLNVSDSYTFTDEADFIGREVTGVFVNYDAFDLNGVGWHRTPNLKIIISQLVDYGFSNGSNVGFQIFGTQEFGKNRSFKSYDSDPSLSAKLIIVYEYEAPSDDEWYRGYRIVVIGNTTDNFYKEHNITGSTVKDLTDYQVRIIAHYGSGVDSGENVYLNSKVQSDFGDIRFQDVLGNNLTYHMIYKEDGDYAVFWVKIPSIPQSPSITTIRIYYNNSETVTTESDPENTWQYFDDFINKAGWSVWLTVGGGSWDNVTLGDRTVFKFTSTASSGTKAIYSLDDNIASMSEGFKYLSFIYPQWTGTVTSFRIMSPFPDAPYGVYFMNCYNTGAYLGYASWSGTRPNWNDGGNVAGNQLTRNAWTNFYLTYWGSTAKVYYNDTLKITKSDYAYNRTDEIAFYCSTPSPSQITYFDYVAIGKFVYPDITHGNWSNETETDIDYQVWDDGNLIGEFDDIDDAYDFIDGLCQYDAPEMLNFTIYNENNLENDGWIFEGEYYRFVLYSANSSLAYIYVDDIKNEFMFGFFNSTKRFFNNASDSGIINLVYANYTEYDFNIFRIEWLFYVDKGVEDNYNTSIYYYLKNANNISETISGIAITNIHIYNLGLYPDVQFSGSSGHIAGGHPFEFYTTNQGDSAYASLIYRKLQMAHLLVELDFDPDWDTLSFTNFTGKVTLEYGFNYRLNGTWIEGWKAVILINSGNIGHHGVTYDSIWVKLAIEWYNRGIKVKTDYINTFTYAYFPDGDVEPERKSFQLWVDLWFSKEQNVTSDASMVSGRINSYYVSMIEKGWWGFGDFNPVFGNVTVSRFQGNLMNQTYGNLDIGEIELVKVYTRMNRHMYNGSVVFTRHFDEMNFRNAIGRMEGIDDPPYVETKIPTIESNHGFLTPLFLAIKRLIDPLRDFLNYNDWFNWLEVNTGFSSLIYIYNNIISYLNLFINNLATIIGYSTDIVTHYFYLLLTFGWWIFNLLQNILSLFANFWGKVYLLFSGAYWVMDQFGVADMFVLFFNVIFPLMYISHVEFSKDPMKTMYNDINWFYGIIGKIYNLLYSFVNMLISFIQTLLSVIP